MKIISKVELSPEEKKAISVIINASCNGIACDVCPFNIAPTLPCVRSMVRQAARNAEIIDEAE